MKKLISTASLSGLVVSTIGFSNQVLAVDVEGKTTSATVKYTEGKLGDESFGSGLPDNLNFGSHKIQNKIAENWIATDNGIDGGTATTGKLNVNDARGSKAGWSVKVAQTDQFTEKGGTGKLTKAALTITTGSASNTGGTAATGGKINSSLTLVPGKGNEQLVFGAKAATGDGISTLDLTKFELAVPAETARKAVEYQVSLTWTLSDIPAS